VCPSAQSGWIGRARRILAVRRCLLNGISCRDLLTGLSSATHAEMSGRRQPIWQDGESPATRTTDPAAHPDTIVLVIVSLAEPPSMADDRLVLANRTVPRQEC
jgi:hypothetical protein